MLKAVCDFKNSRKKKGFTLIELLIVVAIIAILAAIAIPQFSQYRVRGYNSAASSDIRNIKVQTEAFNTDWQVYASSADAGVAGDGAMVVGPLSTSISIAQGGIVAGSPGLPTDAATFNFGVSNGVSAVINTTTATGRQYVAITKHSGGNMGYCADSDKPSINWGTINTATQLNLGVHNAPSTSATNDCEAKYPNSL